MMRVIEIPVDTLPEHTIYRDRGCEVYPACLECPEPRCLEEVPRARQKAAHSSRAATALHMKERGMSSLRIARELGVSRRTAQRASAAVPSGNWGTLTPLETIPDTENMRFQAPFIARPDQPMLTAVEWFWDTVAHKRQLWSHVPAGLAFSDYLWRELWPFNLTGDYGLAIAVAPDAHYAWLSRPDAVYRAPLDTPDAVLTGDVCAVSLTTGLGNAVREPAARLTVDLANPAHTYTAPGTGDLAALQRGNDIAVSFGYKTTAGAESSEPGSCTIEGWTWSRESPGLSLFTVRATGAWEAVRRWGPRYARQFNETPGATTRYELLQWVLARAGIKLNYISRSEAMTGEYPRVAAAPGQDGGALVRRLMAAVPDVLFFKGNTAWLLNPLSADAAVYDYGPSHPVTSVVLSEHSAGACQVIVSGKAAGGPIYAEDFLWAELEQAGPNALYEHDITISDAAGAARRAAALLRREEMLPDSGILEGPPNVAQEPGDVVTITDSSLDMTMLRRRVMNISLRFSASKGAFAQRLVLGGA